MQAGSAAGVVTDIILYPIDTIKTRLQSSEGFYKSGGFSGIYKGIGAAAAGSAPAGNALSLSRCFCLKHLGLKISDPLLFQVDRAKSSYSSCNVEKQLFIEVMEKLELGL